MADELHPDSTLTQALNCLLVETPAGRVLVETGIGERMDERTRTQRGVAGPWILPALAEAGFDPGTVDVVALSHLHFDHAGGLLTHPAAARLPAGARRRAGAWSGSSRWAPTRGSRPRTSRTSCASWSRPASRTRPTATAEVLPGVRSSAPAVTRAATRRSSCGVRRARSGSSAICCMRPWSANPRWVTAFDDFPLTSVEVKATLFRQAADEDWTVVLSHEPRRPVGRFRRDGERIRFEALV